MKGAKIKIVKKQTRLSKGLFFAIEGIDGAGKSSQVNLLADNLKKRGFTVVVTREPTDGQWGRKIRDLYSEQERQKVTPEEEVEYFVFDRQEDVENAIQPALNRGSIVIIDRYFYSNLAYQGARGVSMDLIRQQNAHFPIPDIVFLIDVEPQLGIQRITHNRGEKTNAFEQSEYLERVRALFLSMTDPNICRLDGSLSQAQLQEVILQHTLAIISKYQNANLGY